MKSKNPFLNAAAASVYIGTVVFIMQSMPHVESYSRYLAPIAFLSLFTLSAAVMGYLFLFQPVVLFMEGKKKEGIALFAQTLSVFAAITVAFLLIVSFSAV